MFYFALKKKPKPKGENILIHGWVIKFKAAVLS